MSMTDVVAKCLLEPCLKVRKEGTITRWYFESGHLDWEVDLKTREGRLAVAKCLEAAGAGELDQLRSELLAAADYETTILFDGRDS